MYSREREKILITETAPTLSDNRFCVPFILHLYVSLSILNMVKNVVHDGKVQTKGVLVR